MSRRLEPLTGDSVEHLPVPCSSCLVWELGAPTPARAASRARVGAGSSDGPSLPQVRKQAWVSAQVQDGFAPGRLVRVDGEVAGYALFAPAPAFAPRRAPVPAASPEAFLLATVWIAPHWRERGIGRLLVQAAIKDAIRAGAPAVEAYGDRRFVERACLLPATWLLHEGFEVAREHPRTPLFRLDVKRTVRWTESLEHALEEILGALPRRLPQPVRNGGGRVPGAAPEPYRSDPDHG